MCTSECRQGQGRDCKCLYPSSTGWVYWAILMAVIVAVLLVSEWHDARGKAQQKHAEQMRKVSVDAGRACRDGIPEGCAAMTVVVVATATNGELE